MFSQSVLWILCIIIDNSCSFVPTSRLTDYTQRRSACRNSAINNMMQVWLDYSSTTNNDKDTDDVQQCVAQLEEDPDAVIISKDGCSTSVTALQSCWYKDGNLLKDVNTKKTVGIFVHLIDSSAQERAMAALGSVDWVLVESTSWQMIPAENLIVAALATGTKICFYVDKTSDVAGLARSLELGVDALCINNNANVNNVELWNAAFRARKERNEEGAVASATHTTKEPRIVSGSCWRRETKGIVMADRVCVDLVQTLLPEEGCWIGSSAKTMALILSESASSQFVPTRPFRVNAGPVHSYILMSDNSTKYLCELNAADQVSIYNAKTGSSRGVAVGRLKQEMRPCILVELQEISISEQKDFDYDNISQQQTQQGQVFLQQAETVRLGQEGGKFIRVTDLEAQKQEFMNVGETINTILLRMMSTGTHVGKTYTGKVEER